MRHDRIEAVARAAGEVLEQGLTHGRDVLHTIETTRGGVGPGDLAGLLADRDAMDSAPLVELLLSPGEDVQVRLEPALERAGLTAEEAGEAAEVLARAAGRRRVAVTLPDGAGLAVDFRPEDARTFVRRLRPDRNPPPELVAVLDSREGGNGPDAETGWGGRIKVRLRHSRLAWTRTRVAFLARLLAGLTAPEPGASPAISATSASPASSGPPGAPGAMVRGAGDQAPAGRPGPSAESMAGLDWALAFLDSIDPDEPPLAALGQRYRAVLDQARQAGRVQDMLARSNVEILRMQGMLLSLPHPDELLSVLGLMDLVCRAVTGRPASTFAESSVFEEDLGSHADPAGLIEALRRSGG